MTGIDRMNLQSLSQDGKKIKNKRNNFLGGIMKELQLRLVKYHLKEVWRNMGQLDFLR